jgi:hypothetical protein
MRLDLWCRRRRNLEQPVWRERARRLLGFESPGWVRRLGGDESPLPERLFREVSWWNSILGRLTDISGGPRELVEACTVEIGLRAPAA